MRKAEVYVSDLLAGYLEEHNEGYKFQYTDAYQGSPVSLTMPLTHRSYQFKEFPPFFEGLLPEGAQLDALLRREKLDRKDLFGQLTTVGGDLVGDVTVKASK